MSTGAGGWSKQTNIDCVICVQCMLYSSTVNESGSMVVVPPTYVGVAAWLLCTAIIPYIYQYPFYLLYITNLLQLYCIISYVFQRVASVLLCAVQLPLYPH